MKVFSLFRPVVALFALALLSLACLTACTDDDTSTPSSDYWPAIEPWELDQNVKQLSLQKDGTKSVLLHVKSADGVSKDAADGVGHLVGPTVANFRGIVCEVGTASYEVRERENSLVRAAILIFTAFDYYNEEDRASLTELLGIDPADLEGVRVSLRIDYLQARVTTVTAPAAFQEWADGYFADAAVTVVPGPNAP